MPPKTTIDPNQMMLFADVTPNGSGGFVVTPRKPSCEISSAAAAKLLCVSRSNLCLIVNQPLGQKHLVWRWLTERKGKRMFDLESVLRYRQALKDLAD